MSNTAEYEALLRNGDWNWNKFPLDHATQSALRVAEKDGELVFFDNRRLLLAQNAGLAEIPVTKVNLSEIKLGTTITWQESLNRRLYSSPKGSGLPKVQLPTNGTPNQLKVHPCKK